MSSSLVSSTFEHEPNNKFDIEDPQFLTDSNILLHTYGSFSLFLYLLY